MTHNYAGCQDSACELCDAHGTGYSAGKAKGLFECAVAVSHMNTTPECRCAPCVGLRYAVFSLGEATPGPSAPTPKLGLCVGCGKQKMVIAIGPHKVCSRCWV